MKTIREWIKEMEEPFQSQFNENSSIFLNRNKRFEKLSKVISSGFRWAKSNEGHDYWEKYFIKILELEKKQNENNPNNG
jgi:hypothetical protein